jgi:hypothetical protein
MKRLAFYLMVSVLAFATASLAGEDQKPAADGKTPAVGEKAPLTADQPSADKQVVKTAASEASADASCCCDGDSCGAPSRLFLSPRAKQLLGK